MKISASLFSRSIVKVVSERNEYTKMLNDLRVSEQCFRQIKGVITVSRLFNSLMLTIKVDSKLLEITYGSKRVKMALHSKRISNHFLRQWTIQQLWYLNIGHIDQICVLLVEYRLKL